MSRNRLGVASCAWVALMGIVWALFVPGRLSVGTFTLLSLSGPLLLTAAWMLQSANPPAPSVRRARVAPRPRETDA
jgi:hypothetical protein